MTKSLFALILLVVTTFSIIAQNNDDIPFVTLRSGDKISYDNISLKKGKVVGEKDGVEKEYDVELCKYVVIATRKNNKLVIKRQVVFSNGKILGNLGGEAELMEGTVAYNIVAKNGDELIIYHNSPMGAGGISGNQTNYYHVKAGKVSKFGFEEWRDDSYMQELVDTFGICPEMLDKLQKFKSSGASSRQLKYDFFLQSLEKAYLLNCIN